MHHSTASAIDSIAFKCVHRGHQTWTLHAYRSVHGQYLLTSERLTRLCKSLKLWSTSNAGQQHRWGREESLRQSWKCRHIRQEVVPVCKAVPSWIWFRRVACLFLLTGLFFSCKACNRLCNELPLSFSLLMRMESDNIWRSRPENLRKGMWKFGNSCCLVWARKSVRSFAPYLSRE